MVKGLYAAYTGMLNEEHRMDVITNNLANIDTNGYKKEGMTSQAFSDVLGYKIKDLSEAPATARYEGVLNLGVKIGEGYTDFSQGPYRPATRMTSPFRATAFLPSNIRIRQARPAPCTRATVILR